jgi:hypothetical protein
MKTEQNIKELPRLVAGAEGMRDLLLADVVMIARFFRPRSANRSESASSATGSPNMTAGMRAGRERQWLGGAPGAEGRRNLLVAAHADTIVAAERDQVIEWPRIA